MASPDENLACDEVLLELCAEDAGREVLRFWEPQEYFVVLGYSSKISSEVNLSACTGTGIPVLRRCSGGGTVLQGPGCLNYSLLLQAAEAGPLQSIGQTNAFILKKVQQALQPLTEGRIEIQGVSDLTLAGAKFCGNAQRRKRGCVLFHGSVLLDMDIAAIERHLPLPAKQPAYRGNRKHEDFLINLRVPPAAVKAALKSQWRAERQSRTVPRARVEALVEKQYATQEWISKF